MAKTPEGRVKDSVKKLFDEYEVWYCMPATHGYGRSGVPDFISCYMGHFIAVETKTGKKQPTALQQREIRRIQEAGGYALVINEDNLHELRALLNEIQACQQS